jgi:hypothetical protein
MDPANEPIRFDPASSERRVRNRRVSSGWVRRDEIPPAMARIAWSGVWGGFLIAVGIWITLIALGTAVGLSRAGANLPATFGRASAAWLYVSALIALFFGAAFGTRLALILDGAIVWLEATLIWTFALLLTAFTMALLGIAAARAAAANAVTQSSTVIANPGARGAWLMFAGIVIAWIITVLGSFRGRAQSVTRAHMIGIAA